MISNDQFGFRQNHTTIEQLHRVVDEIKEIFEGKEYYTVAFLDFSQVFDTIKNEGSVRRLLCRATIQDIALKQEIFPSET